MDIWDGTSDSFFAEDLYSDSTCIPDEGWTLPKYRDRSVILKEGNSKYEYYVNGTGCYWERKTKTWLYTLGLRHEIADRNPLVRVVPEEELELSPNGPSAGVGSVS